MNTEQILKSLIARLYNESVQDGLQFQLNKYQTGGDSYLQAHDGQFLGYLSSQYDSNSLFNQYGPYGSKYSPTSIFNQYAQYGSKYSALSPFNKYTATPPTIYINGREFGKLTANKYIAGARQTDAFLFYTFNQMDLIDNRLDDLAEFISRME